MSLLEILVKIGVSILVDVPVHRLARFVVGVAGVVVNGVAQILGLLRRLLGHLPHLVDQILVRCCNLGLGPGRAANRQEQPHRQCHDFSQHLRHIVGGTDSLTHPGRPAYFSDVGRAAVDVVRDAAGGACAGGLGSGRLAMSNDFDNLAA